MEKFRLPPEYKDFYHIKQEDLDRLNKHIEYFESQNKKRKYIRRWVFGGVILIVAIMFVFGVIDLSYFRNLFEGRTFLIKDRFEIDGKKVDIRISMPKEGMINVIIEVDEGIKEYMVISNRYETKGIKVDDGIGLVSMRYDDRIFVLFDGFKRAINIERLKPME